MGGGVAFTAAVPFAGGSVRLHRRTWMCMRSGGGESDGESGEKERGTLRARPARRGGETAAAEASGGGERQAAQLQSGVLSAMRDYFGDDGREVADFCARPRTARGMAMFRVLIVGSGERELQLAKRLNECDAVLGVYYVADDSGACSLQFSDVATATGVVDIVAFVEWARVDAVFVGPDRAGAVESEQEKLLSGKGVTVFPHDVSAAVADNTLDAVQCLAPLADEANAAADVAVAGDPVAEQME